MCVSYLKAKNIFNMEIMTQYRKKLTTAIISFCDFFIKSHRIMMNELIPIKIEFDLSGNLVGAEWVTE